MTDLCCAQPIDNQWGVSANLGNKTLRYHGAQLVLNIHYSNLWHRFQSLQTLLAPGELLEFHVAPPVSSGDWVSPLMLLSVARGGRVPLLMPPAGRGRRSTDQVPQRHGSPKPTAASKQAPPSHGRWRGWP